ncbi:hypothetical protein AB0H34_47635 [Saccharopolyspora shandongensis]|uniref:hypothetical protein n=1 Tax=Saccharopolyspora shandongensis TaxID=418495 RepID=UPI0033DA29EB
MTTKLVTAFANAGRPTAFATTRLTGEPAITGLTGRLPTTARRAGRLTDPRTARHIATFAAGHAGGFGPGLPRAIGLTGGFRPGLPRAIGLTGGFRPGLPRAIGLTRGLTGGFRARVGLIVGDNLAGVGYRPGVCPVGLGLREAAQPVVPGGPGRVRNNLARDPITGDA